MFYELKPWFVVMGFWVPNVKKILKFQNKKNEYNTAIQYNRYKKALLVLYVYKQKVSMIYSDRELNSFLSLTNKRDFSSELFSDLLIC